MFLIDAHLDLAMNALRWNRDLKRAVHEIRAAETGMDEKGRGGSTVSFPEMRRGEVGVACCTMLARVERPDSPATGFRDHDIAYASAQGELAYYRQLERQGEVELLYDWPAVERCASRWLNRQPGDQDPRLGLILTMEGADPIVAPSQLESWRSDGLRILSLVHYGVSKYAHGTGTNGPLSADGRELLREMERLGLILDVTPLSEQSFYEALERFSGPVMASHNNCTWRCPGDRQFTDDQVKLLIQRDGVIGAALDAWMLHPGWVKGETLAHDVNLSLESVVDNIDHVCQLAGNTRHAAIGSDLDGGFGREQVPHDLDTIADLQNLGSMLKSRGYTDPDIRAIFHGNWLQFWSRALPQ
jgi:membrane dipeptidase